MRETLHQCALDHPEIALTVDEWPSTALDVGAAEATLWLGSPPEGYSGSATLLGWEQIVIIANPDIPLTEIELADIRQIYTSIEPQYQAWSFPENSELRVVFDEVVLENNQISPHTKIAPNPGKLLEAIDGGSQGLGYITQSWLPAENVQIVPINAETASALRQPILALTTGEPQGGTRNLLACLTTKLSQSENPD